MRSQFVVTSNGVRTLLVVAGTPTTLSRQTTFSVGSLPGSLAGSVAGSVPGSPIKHVPGSPMRLPTVPLPHSLSVPGVALPHPFSHAGGAALPHSVSQPVMRSSSSVPVLVRGTSGSVPHALLHRGGSSTSSSHRLMAGGGDSAGSRGSTPRDPTARV